jgi:hypothetical protein
MVQRFEEDGTVLEEAEKLCRHAMPMIIGVQDNIWCRNTSQICYKCLDEVCEDEEFDIPSIV